ncbi:MAG: hypothetical protein PHE83_03120 [Opitutaceae bacterium]|nr:hypothetical protein [Opitutaceae bacterium]
MTAPAAKSVLQENLAGLRQALATLERTWQEAQALGAGPVYTDRELDLIEVLAGRFARTTDFLVNKVLRSLDRFELEPEGTLIDVINRAEKRGVIASARDLRRMKELRNEIAHEYLPSGQIELLADLKIHVLMLLEAGKRTLAHASRALKNAP